MQTGLIADTGGAIMEGEGVKHTSFYAQVLTRDILRLFSNGVANVMNNGALFVLLFVALEGLFSYSPDDYMIVVV